ncbi:type I phosphodiesterase / nucleotide pyrophosphatase domain-containing protein [Ditylenchus destructor]|uniref:Type I phosphodiesterase / nucleotide pyrophosphatase domain-containing protein n=1 Tax=Ditylenchus destructor TaxID=166010 RepID=A0AAD4RBC8_9BILA|nr:type I phosphodiesterase / nucleotide pyrophosphatase domain-containing protein [Ditylenchus destructor]
MFPSYPSKTFPNHYSIATGLYPESHGIVDNSIYDPTISEVLEDMKRTNFSGFYLGEPIWSAAVRQRRRMFCLFWPGCQFNMTDYPPTHSLPYDKSLPYSTRVDMIVDWLLLPASERPSLIMAYFDQPDNVGHFHTTDQQVNLELGYLDSVLNYLFTSLYKNGLFDCTNLIIVSDHGMQFLNKRYFVDEMFDTDGMVITAGVMGRIHVANSTKSLDWLEEQLKCKNKEKFHIYNRETMPRRYHYAKTPRVGDLLLDGQLGTTFYPSVIDDYHVTSDHGYDYTKEPMRAIFFARGPNIRPKTDLPPFQNVELFNLFSDLLRLSPDVPTNGTIGLLDEVIYNMNINPRLPTTIHRPVPECSPLILFQRREIKSCLDMDICRTEAAKANSTLEKCVAPISAPGLFYAETSSTICTINLCSVIIGTSFTPKLGVSTLVFETLDGYKLSKDELAGSDNNASGKCSLIDNRFDRDCTNWTQTLAQHRLNSVKWSSIMADNTNEMRDFNQQQFLFHNGFLTGGFIYLQNITQAYAKKYNRITTITGTIYDFNNDGLADTPEIYWQHQNKTNHLELLPSHVFRMIMRCEDDQWHINGISCKNSSSTRILSFVLPNQPTDMNCLTADEYLMVNTARIKDIELLTNVNFFSDRTLFLEKESMIWRTNITTSLWPL